MAPPGMRSHTSQLFAGSARRLSLFPLDLQHVCEQHLLRLASYASPCVVAKRSESLLTRAGDVSGSRGRRRGRGGVGAVAGSQIRWPLVPCLHLSL